MAELKPCPFCGGEVLLEWDYYCDTYIVYCRDCGCYVRQHYTVKDEAIEAWNRRSDNGHS